MANLLSTSVTGTVNSTGNMTAAGFTGNANVGGTGAATWHPSGIYVGSTQWLYGTMYKNGSSIQDVSEIKMNGGPYLQTYNDRNLIVKGNSSSDAGIEGRNAADSNVFQIYGTGSEYGFLNGTWAAWDLKKTKNGALYMNDNNSYYLQTNNTSNFYALNIQGNAVVHAGNINSQSVSYATSAGVLTSMNISQFTNNSGYITSSSLSSYLPLVGGSMTGDITMISNAGIQYSSTHWIRPRDSSGNLHIKADTGGIYLDTDVIHLRGAGGVNDTTVSGGHITTAGGYYTNAGLSTNAGGALTVQSPGGASRANGASSETGAFKIKLPAGLPVYGMFKLVIHIYEYGARGNGYEIHCGGHLYPSYMHNRFQVQYGASNSPLTVRYGNDGSTGCIWIGNLDTTWSYPQIWVSEFMIGYNNTSWTTWRSGWSITLDSASFGNSGAMDGPHTCDFGYAASAAYATTAGSAPNASNLNTSYGVTAGAGNGLKFWNGSDSYKIHMGNSAEYHYGPVTDYSIKTNIDSNGATRGFTWGTDGGTPIAALNVGNGNMQIAGTFNAANFSGSSSGTNTGDQTNISGNAATATNVAWTGVTSRPTALSQFTNDLGNYGGWITSSGSISGSAGSAGYASYLPPAYVGGAQNNPQVYFNYNIGLKVAMTGAWSVWSDTVWVNGYNGDDVPWMCAMHFLRNSEPRMAISAQRREGTEYGTYYEVITAYNIASQSVSYATTAGNSNSISNAVGNTHTWTGANYFRSNLGATSGALSSPPLQVYCTGGNSAFMSFHRSGNYAVNFGLDSDNVLRMGGWSATANRWQLDMSGNMTVAGDVTAFSDARVKTNVQTIENALDKTLALRGVSYNRTDSDDTRTKIGVIAQETLEVLPEVVNQDNSGMYNVSYGNMTALLIEAIKEQQAQIEDLKLEVKKLRGE